MKRTLCSLRNMLFQLSVSVVLPRSSRHFIRPCPRYRQRVYDRIGRFRSLSFVFSSRYRHFHFHKRIHARERTERGKRNKRRTRALWTTCEFNIQVKTYHLLLNKAMGLSHPYKRRVLRPNRHRHTSHSRRRGARDGVAREMKRRPGNVFESRGEGGERWPGFRG